MVFVGIGETDDTCGEHRLGGRLARTACHQSTQAVVVGRRPQLRAGRERIDRRRNAACVR